MLRVDCTLCREALTFRRARAVAVRRGIATVDYPLVYFRCDTESVIKHRRCVLPSARARARSCAGVSILSLTHWFVGLAVDSVG